MSTGGSGGSGGSGSGGGDASTSTDDNTNASNATDSGPGRREVAYRLFAAEFDDASLSYSESDEERAPNYVVTPTGLRVNRLFAVGVLTEVERINTDTIRGRIADPTGAFVTYAGQYQPEAQAFLDRTEPPAFVAITGKARTFEPDDSDRVFTSVRPESLSEVTADTRDRWVVSAAEHTLERIAVFAAARETGLAGESLRAALSEAGVDHSIAAGIPRAMDHYGTTTAYLEAVRRLAVDALEVVAGEREDVRPVDVAPGEGGETTIGPLPETDLDLGDDGPQKSDAESEAIADSEPGSSTAESPASASGESTMTQPKPTETTASESTVSPPAETEPTAEPTPSSAAADDQNDTADDGLATFEEPADSVASEVDTDAESASFADDEAGLYQLDDEEREELEAEFGSSFSSGNEIDPAGEADIDVPDVDELAEEVAERDAEREAETADSLPPDPTEPTGSTDAAESTGSPAAGDADLGSFSSEPAVGAESTDDSVSDELGDDSAVEESPTADTDTADETDDGAADVDLEDAAVDRMAELDDGDGADREKVIAALVSAHGVDPEDVEAAIGDALMSGRCYEPTAGVLKPI